MPPRRDFAKVLSALSDGQAPAPFYALVGEESTLVSEAVISLRNHCLTAAPDFNRDEFGAESGAKAVSAALDACQTMPMMAPRRWVHLSNIHKLSAKDAEPLVAYLAQPSPTTVLCLSGTKVDGRYKFGKSLVKHKAAFSFDPPKGQALPGWIADRANSLGMPIAMPAAVLLAELVGNNVGSIDRNLEKLWLYGYRPDSADAHTIDLEDVEAIVAPTQVRSIFEFTDALGARNLARASILLRNALGGGQAGLMVLAMVARQFRLLLKVKEAMASAKHPAQVAKAAGVPPFLVDGLQAQARTYSFQELHRALRATANADRRLKTTRLDAGVVLDRLLLEVTAQSPSARSTM